MPIDYHKNVDELVWSTVAGVHSHHLLHRELSLEDDETPIHTYTHACTRTHFIICIYILLNTYFKKQRYLMLNTSIRKTLRMKSKSDSRKPKNMNFLQCDVNKERKIK